jgi:hypothetical protein
MSVMIPTDEFWPKVLPQGQLAYQNIHAAPEAFGGQMGQTLQRIGDMSGKEAVARQHVLNKVGADDVYANQFDPGARAIYEEYLTLKDKDAAQGFPAYRQRMENLAAEIRANLPNELQQSEFDLMAGHRMQANLDAMSRHQSAQTGRWIGRTGDAMAGMLERRIKDDRYDFDGVAGSNGLIQGIRNVYAKYGEAAGQDPDASALKAAASIDRGLSDAVLTEARLNPAGAKMLYDRYGPFMSSDAMRQRVLDNVLPAVRQEQNEAVYRDVISRFDLMNPRSNIDAATGYVLDPNNYQDQLTGPGQRNDMAKSIRGAWNRAIQFHKENQSSADSSFTAAVANGDIAGLSLQTWRDPETGLPPSDDILRAAMEHGANSGEKPVAGNAGTLAGLANELSNGSMADPGPINRAYLGSLITGRDFHDLTALYAACRDPAKSRWFESARAAFYSRYADPNGPDGINADAMALFPRYLTDLNQAVADQGLKGAQIRDSADKMLQDIDRDLVGRWFGDTPSAFDFANYHNGRALPQIDPVVHRDPAPAAQAPQQPQQTAAPQQPAASPTPDQSTAHSPDQAGLEWVNAYITKAYGDRVPLTDNNVRAAYDQFKTQDPEFWKNWKIGE